LVVPGQGVDPLKNESTYAKKFAAELRQIKSKHKTDAPPELDLVTQMVMGFLEWNATRKSALEAHDRLMEVLVDNNDLRVSLPNEIGALIGADYPQLNVRISRLRETLHEIYVREYDVTLDHLIGKNKKQVRTYLETLPGITPYVVNQIMLLNFGFHAMPVDDFMLELFKKDDVVDPDASVEDVAKYLEKIVKAGDGVDIHSAMRAWADVRFRAVVAASQRTKKTTRKKPATRKSTTKKTTTRKSTTRKAPRIRKKK
jgi:endonuclease III